MFLGIFPLYFLPAEQQVGPDVHPHQFDGSVPLLNPWELVHPHFLDHLPKPLLVDLHPHSLPAPHRILTIDQVHLVIQDLRARNHSTLSQHVLIPHEVHAPKLIHVHLKNTLNKPRKAIRTIRAQVLRKIMKRQRLDNVLRDLIHLRNVNRPLLLRKHRRPQLLHLPHLRLRYPSLHHHRLFGRALPLTILQPLLLLLDFLLQLPLQPLLLH